MTAGTNDCPCGLMGMSMKSDGGGYEHLNASFQNSMGVKAMSEETVASGQSKFCNIEMNGQEVYKWAVRGVPKVMRLQVGTSRVVFRIDHR